MDKYKKIGRDQIKIELLDALEALRTVLTFKEVLLISKRIGERLKAPVKE